MNNGHLSAGNMGTEGLLSGGTIVSPQSCVTLNLLSGQSSWAKVLLFMADGRSDFLTNTVTRAGLGKPVNHHTYISSSL